MNRLIYLFILDTFSYNDAFGSTSYLMVAKWSPSFTGVRTLHVMSTRKYYYGDLLGPVKRK